MHTQSELSHNQMLKSLVPELLIRLEKVAIGSLAQ